MPTGQGDHSKVTNALSIGDRAALLIEDINLSFERQFQRRNAVHKKVALKAEHKFRPILVTEGTKCSHCAKLVWFTGHSCEQCKLMVHRKCLPLLKVASCKAFASPALKSSGPKLSTFIEHEFVERIFLKLTLCDHCGTTIWSVTRLHQGLECKTCKRSVHFECLKWVCSNCCSRESTFDDKPLAQQHESKINIKDFELIRILGEGSFSKVYLAKLKSTKGNSAGEFAIKVIKKTNMAISSDPESVFTEKRILSIGRNYHFLSIAHACFQSVERLFFVMDYVAGRDLLYHIRKARKFTEERAKFHAAEIVLALVYLHNRGFIYRDLKLDNIILDKEGHCKLLDFGMSKELKESRLKARTFCGTPSYIAPEIIREQEYDFSVDWWSLGVLLYEMLVGFSPFEAHSEDQMYRSILKEPVQLPRLLSDRAQSILDGLLTKDPQNRLGCQLLEGCSRAVQEHPFFLFKTNNGEDFQWEAIETKLLRPPYIPTQSDWLDEDESSSRINLTPVSERDLKELQQDDFDGFSSYSESFESLAGGLR